MKRALVIVAAVAALAGAVPSAVLGADESAKPGAARQTRWPELVPPGWDPMALLRQKMKDRGPVLSDADPRAMTMLREMRDIWDNAPVNEELNGTLVKLPGYVVPLEEARGGVKEFLLVPYFGACIHSPPPPANQIVHVVPAKAAQGLRAMDVVWVIGRLQARRQDSYMGRSGYHMEAAKLEPYVPPPQ